MNYEEFKNKYTHEELCVMRKENNNEYKNLKDMHKKAIEEALSNFNFHKVIEIYYNQNFGMWAPIFINDDWDAECGNMLSSNTSLQHDTSVAKAEGNVGNCSDSDFIDESYWSYDDNDRERLIHVENDKIIDESTRAEELALYEDENWTRKWIEEALSEFERECDDCERECDNNEE